MRTLGIKSGQHVRIDVRYKHRDGNSEEKKKERNARDQNCYKRNELT